jgi:hypothetical protein
VAERCRFQRGPGVTLIEWITRFHLIGMSYEAYIAQGIMDEMTERVKGIALPEKV